MKKNNYEQPKIEIMHFSEEDVLTTSGESTNNIFYGIWDNFEDR